MGSIPLHRSKLERATQWHTAIFVIASAWMFGGRIYWAQFPLILCGAAGACLTILGFVDRYQRGLSIKRWIIWLLPALTLGVWILAGSFNPNMEEIWFYEQLVLRPRAPIPWLPSSASPNLARSELALMFGVYLTGFNVALNTHKRRTLRELTACLGLNACVLACFGIVQKLLGTDIFFGLEASPNKSFFASFIYHNHWGPFALINIAGWFGLVKHLSHDNRGRGFFNSPGVFALLAVLLLMVSIPLSTSRSSTAMMSVLVTVCGLWLVWLFSRHGISRRGQIIRISAGLVALLFGAAAAYNLGEDSIRDRLIDTREQIAAIKETGGVGQRARVYSDTLQMIRDRPIAGWGFESYATVYRRYSTEPKTVEGWTVQFNEAHSDWLQLFAETGSVGALLFVTTWLLPIYTLKRRLFSDPYSGAPMLCLALLAIFAWVEFPFANPAVCISAWVSFFGLIRYLQLSGISRSPANSNC